MTLQKINGSVAILTLNSEKTLKRCLESIKDFAEIIVCDGNSTDNTIDIAKKYDAKIIPQFDSKKKNLKITDKAKIRNIALEASTNDWHFWLDSDDSLSPQLVTEIRKITSLKQPRRLIYQIPLRHVIAGKIIKHSSNYPFYQYRFFNKKTGARFIKPIHERIDFNRHKFSVGKLSGFYNIHWSKKRATSFWETIKHYNKLELDWLKDSISWRWYIRWVLGFQLLVWLGMTFRITVQFIRFGFNDSMPVRIEFARWLGKAKLILDLTFMLFKKTFKL